MHYFDVSPAVAEVNATIPGCMAYQVTVPPSSFYALAYLFSGEQYPRSMEALFALRLLSGSEGLARSVVP
jgi:hypothetical protein